MRRHGAKRGKRVEGHQGERHRECLSFLVASAPILLGNEVGRRIRSLSQCWLAVIAIVLLPRATSTTSTQVRGHAQVPLLRGHHNLQGHLPPGHDKQRAGCRPGTLMLSAAFQRLLMEVPRRSLTNPVSSSSASLKSTKPGLARRVPMREISQLRQDRRPGGEARP